LNSGIIRTRSRIQDAPDAGTPEARAALGLAIGTDVGAPGVVPTLTAHPTPSASNVGLAYLFSQPGVADDKLFLVVQLADGTYAARQIATG
jgi:hypothetical protein